MPVRTLRRLAVCAAAAALTVSAAACGATSSTPSSSASPSPTAAAGTKTITYSRVIDLQHVISPDIPLWPGDPKVVFKTVATMEKDGYYLRSFTIGEHSATHMNAPNSFIAGDKRSITSYEAEQLVVPAAVIDAREQCAADPDYQLSKQDVLDWEAVKGQLTPGTFVIMYTGWQDKWNDPKAFFNIDGQGNLHFPGFAGDTTTWLLSDRQIAGVGIDTHGVDPGLDTSYATNTQTTGAHKIVIECLGNLDQLPATGATLVLGILRLKDGSGSPLSVMAFVP
ncbi:MAG: cyclase family protein [Actinobacteria bacterium]|nr:cyclase family protein [Actinomycetota bacterium]